MPSNALGRVLPIFAILTALCANAAGQSTASLHGTVTDAQGALIPSVAVTLNSAENGTTRKTLTDATGAYSFLQLAPSTYRVIAEKPGFTTARAQSVNLPVNTPTTLDLRMEVGNTADVVNVVAEAEAVNTSDATVGNAFTERQIRQLPLETRNVVELLSLQPGVTPNGEVLGARRDQNNITLDGVDVNNNQNSGLQPQNAATGTGGFQGSNANGSVANSGFNAVLPIPLDSVQEFRVTVAGEGASQGRSSGGQVALITKSGTNQLHGSLYEYHRNTLTAANTWFNNQAGVGREPLIRNQFGGSVGGRVVRDRVFYFFNYEQRTDASGVSQVRAVPSESLRHGFLKFQLADGSVATLSPAEIRSIDPLNQGVNPAALKVLNQYPVGNSPNYGQDGGLNFSGLRFNAPSHRNDRAIVGKMDFHLDAASKHTLSLRGTLASNTDDQVLAQFPGQAPASTLRDNSKGLAAQYTAILKANLINVANLGYTRFSPTLSGVSGPVFFLTAIDPLQNFNARASQQRLPTFNPSDDVTWIKGKHTFTAGLNFRFIHNNSSSFGSSFAQYGYGATELIGLGADIDNLVTAYIQQRTGNPAAQLADPTSVTNGAGALFGLVNDAFHTDQFDRRGNPLAQGTPQVRSFIEHDYAGYVGDSYRASRELTLTVGLRYENFRPPYEAKGYQVAPTFGLDQFFAERNGLQKLGVPQNAMPHATLSWALNGPANGKPTWWSPSNKNFAPRVSLAYAPSDKGGVLGKLFGKSGVLRAGAAMAYDRFGSDLITQYDQYGSIGLATKSNFPDSYSFGTSPRFTGSAPDLPAVPKETFPLAPPDIAAISGEFLGISPNLKPPSSYVLNSSFAREIPGKMTIEVGYTGRLSHRLLMQGDVYTPLEYFKDPASGITWEQNAATVRALSDSGVTPAAVAANPSLVPRLPFVENIWPGLKNADFPGSASANYFSCVYGDYGGSFLDCLHALDRNTTSSYAPGQCISKDGCYTFFPRQGSSMPTWMNAGNAQFHGMTVSLRRAFSHGVSFDFNYTWSHSIDYGSAAESGAGQQGAAIQNVFNVKEFRGSSDFDIRHNISADYLFELPVGRNRAFLRNMPGWLDQVVGGWQVSSVMRYRSGLPTAVGGDLAYNANYWLSSLAIATKPVSLKRGIDTKGNPSIFASPDAAGSFEDQLPGHSGSRAVVRLAPFFNTDLTLAKVFRLPKEGQRLQFRAEAFNAFNSVNFTNPSLTLTSPLTFGEFQGVTPPRTMQFALRYEF